MTVEFVPEQELTKEDVSRPALVGLASMATEAGLADQGTSEDADDQAVDVEPTEEDLAAEEVVLETDEEYGVLLVSISGDQVKDYLKQIRKTPLLSAEKEVELAKSIRAGVSAQEQLDDYQELDEELRRELEQVAEKGRGDKNHMIEANLRLVVSMAKRYTGRGMLFMDLIQEGNIGLIRAVEKFDYAKGYKFSTYATWWIRQAITSGMANQSRTVRLPVHMAETVNKLNRVQRQMLQDLGREPTLEELAKELEMAPADVVELQNHDRSPISMSIPIGEDGSEEFGNLLPDRELGTDERAFMTVAREDLIVFVDNALNEEQAEFIKLRFGLVDGVEHTVGEAAAKMGISEGRARAMGGRAMHMLRNPDKGGRILLSYISAKGDIDTSPTHH